MKKLVSTLVLLGTVATSAFAQTGIQDPQNLLGTLDGFVDAKEFSQAFKAHDSIVLESQECTIYNDGNGSYMDCMTEEESKSVIEVDTQYALLNDNFAIVKNVYERYDRNPVRFWLHMQKQNIFASLQANGLAKSNMNNGYVRLERLVPTTFEVLGQSLKAQKLEISVVMIADDGTEIPFPFYVIVAKGLPFMGQVAEMGLEMEIDGHILPPAMKVIDFQKN